MNALIYLLHKARLSILLWDLSAIPSNMGDEPRADISAKWEFERFKGLITRNPHRPQNRLIVYCYHLNMVLKGNAFRQLFLLAASFISAITAHIISGGGFLGVAPMSLQIGCIMIVLLATRNVSLEGPSLALALVIIQSTSHFILGGNTYGNELRMTLGHFLSGISTYWAISYFDHAWNLFLGILRSIAFPVFSRLNIYQIRVFRKAFEVRLLTLRSQINDSLRYRGPPAIIGVNHES